MPPFSNRPHMTTLSLTCINRAPSCPAISPTRGVASAMRRAACGSCHRAASLCTLSARAASTSPTQRTPLGTTRERGHGQGPVPEPKQKQKQGGLVVAWAMATTRLLDDLGASTTERRTTGLLPRSTRSPREPSRPPLPSSAASSARRRGTRRSKRRCTIQHRWSKPPTKRRLGRRTTTHRCGRPLAPTGLRTWPRSSKHRPPRPLPPPRCSLRRCFHRRFR